MFNSVQLHERYRPRSFAEVVGQAKAIKQIACIRKVAGTLAGQGYFITGASGTGKTTIARLIAAEASEDYAIQEYKDPAELDSAELARIDRDCRQRPFGRGSAYIINEAHGLKPAQIRQLLGILEALPPWVTVIFTTTSEAQESLFDDRLDSHPFLSRCNQITLSRRDLAQAFAERVRAIAIELELDGGAPLAKFVKLAQACKNNMREMLTAVMNGEFIGAELAVA